MNLPVLAGNTFFAAVIGTTAFALVSRNKYQ